MSNFPHTTTLPHTMELMSAAVFHNSERLSDRLSSIVESYSLQESESFQNHSRDSDLDDITPSAYRRRPVLKSIDEIVVVAFRNENSGHNNKNKSDHQAGDYMSYYERAESFLDDKGLFHVEPDAEVRVKKHFNISTNIDLLTSNQSNSIISEGSPSLKEITGSSLLARRCGFRTDTPVQSPISTSKDSNDSTPNSLKMLNHNTAFHPNKVCRFADKTASNSNYIAEDNADDAGIQIPSHSPKCRKKVLFSDWKLTANITNSNEDDCSV